MLRKTSSRLIFPLHRFVSTQKPQTAAKSVFQRELEERKESWTPIEDLEKEPEKEPTEREKKIRADKERIDQYRFRNLQEEKWQSKFAIFFNKEPDMRALIFFQQPLDLRPSNIKRMWNDFQIRKEAMYQSFIKERFQLLGPDLAVAHFILYRQGKIKFKGDSKWFTDADRKSLPKFSDLDYVVEAINYDNQPLHYEGVENITNLKECKSISLRNVRHFNDWCLDRLAGNYLPGLEELDISGTDVTRFGLESLYKLPSLKRLIVDKSKMNTIECQLVFSMLEEMKLDLNVLDSSDVKQECDIDSASEDK